MYRFPTKPGYWVWIAAVALFAGRIARSDDTAERKQQLRLLQEHNRQMQDQLNKPQRGIESLTRRIAAPESASQEHAGEIQSLKTEIELEPAPASAHFAHNRFPIPNVPAGAYKSKVAHERLPPAARAVAVPENGTVTVDFALGITGLPEY